MGCRGMLGLCVVIPACLWKPELPATVVDSGSYNYVSIGARHVCARDNTAIYCWGDNRLGQVGVATAGDIVMAPVRVGQANTWTSMSAGGEHSCGIHDGIAECWGNNENGQVLGTANSAFPSPMPTIFVGTPPLFEFVAAGARHSCAIGHGQLWCWGRTIEVGANASGAGGTRVDTRDDWRGVSTGDSFTCGIAGSDVLCFGENTRAQCGAGASSAVATPLVVPLGPGLVPLRVAAGVEVACAVAASSAQANAGQLWCWGSNADKLIVDDNAGALEVPTRIGSDDDWTDIAVGAQRACGIHGGQVVCWGNSFAGGFGDGIWEHYRVAFAFAGHAGPADDVEVAAGAEGGRGNNELGCALYNHTLSCWGDSMEGELGIGSRTLQEAPIPIAAPVGETWQHVWAGAQHTCGSTDQAFYCWGATDHGEVDGSAALGADAPCTARLPCDAPTPTRGPSIGVPDEVVTGRFYTCARVGTEIWCWGANDLGELGAPTPVGHSARKVAGSWQKLFGGAHATCGVTTIGALACWGDVAGTMETTPVVESASALVGVDEMSFGDQFGCGHDPVLHVRVCWGRNMQNELGDGTLIDIPTPTAVDYNVDHMVVAGAHGCESFAQQVYCWGLNTSGEAGQPATPTNLVPLGALVDDPNGPIGSCTQLALGSVHSCAVCAGTAYCWGDNSTFQLGRGVSDAHGREVAFPAALPVGVTVEEIAAGDDHTCALDNQHALYCWGYNRHGQLGDGGHAVNLPTPVGPRQ